jgi:acetyltransferase
MNEPSRNLARLFAPASVAVVGASASPSKAGYQALAALRGFPGRVVAINAKADGPISGFETLPSLRAVGAPVDLVLFAVPAAACPELMREAIDCGCGGGLIVGGGFAESGPAGAELQAELGRLCASSSFRLLGPNTAGFVNKQASLTACFVPSVDRLARGPIAVVAQSAGINLTVSFLLARLGSGISQAIGLGNAVDVDAADVLDFLAAQPDTKAIALHLEGVNQGRKLFDTLRRVTPRKPVAVLAVGRQDVGDFARSHTGNLLGSHALCVSALRQAGAVVVESTEDLATTAAALSLHRLAPKSAPGIGVVTAQAGAGLVMLDLLKANGVTVPELGPATLQRLSADLPPITYLKNPVDTGRPGPTFADVLTAVTEDPRIDAVICYALSEPAALLPAAVLPVLARGATKPILFGTMGPRDELEPTLAELRSAGIFAAESPEQLARAAIGLAQDAAAQTRLALPQPERPSPRLIVPDVPDEHSVKLLLEGMGIPAPDRRACASHEQALEAFGRLQKPVVAKVLSSEVLHKTEVSGVKLNLADRAAFTAALVRLDAIPLAGQRRYLIEEMAPPGLELIVGALRNPSFGPTVVVGLGGTLAEVWRLTATRLAPLTSHDAEAMLEELGITALLEGFRNAPPLDRAAVIRLLVSVGDVIHQHPEIEQLELNPVRLYQHGLLALDALLIRTPSAG